MTGDERLKLVDVARSADLVVGLPVVGDLGIAIADQAVRLLPNLI